MNKLNEKIIRLLTEDAKMSISDIAAACGVKADEAAKAIKALETSGVILKYSAVINTNKLDAENVQALIEVRVAPQKSKGFDKLAEEIYTFPEVKSVFLMSGGFDLAVFIEGKSLKEVAFFVSEKLASMESVVSTSTHFILKKYKSDGVVFSDIAETNRLPISH